MTSREYIEREALRLAIFNTRWQNFQDVDIAYDMADSILAADVVPVVHGRWGKTDYFDVHFCSCCNEATNTRLGLPNYCPNCGARMDGE